VKKVRSRQTNRARRKEDGLDHLEKKETKELSKRVRERVRKRERERGRGCFGESNIHTNFNGTREREREREEEVVSGNPTSTPISMAL
jgi:hypothetical protein